MLLDSRFLGFTHSTIAVALMLPGKKKRHWSDWHYPCRITMLTISKVYLLANIVQKFCKPCRFFQNSYESSWRVIWFYIGFFCYESIITLLEFEDRKEALHAWNNGLLKPHDHLQDLYANFYFTRCSNTFIPSSQLPLFKKSVQCNLSEEPI